MAALHSVLLVAAIAVLAMFCTPRNDEDARPNLAAAIEIANWLQSVRIETAGGIAWPVNPDQPDAIERNLYSGTPGVILFLLELHHATGDRSYLDEAARGADGLLGWLADSTGELDPGLWTGLAGQAFVLHQVYLTTGELRHLAGAERCLAQLKRQAKPGPDGAGVEFNDCTDIISGSAGIGLFLLYAAREMGDAGAFVLAVSTAERLVALGRPVEMEHGRPALKWAMTPEYPRLMPNFSHGTAGVCYFLARMHEALTSAAAGGTGEVTDRYLNAARAGAEYLLSMADRSDDGCRIFHHEPDGEELYYLGWCHGPVGTARLFHQLAKVTGEEEWTRWMHRGARSIMASGIPDKRTEGFWNNAGQCCGSAGVAAFFLDLHRLDPRDDYLRFAQAMNRDILSRVTRLEMADGRSASKWIHAEHRVQPELLIAQTGYMQGAAGIGLWLLQMDARDAGRTFGLKLPDTPFNP